MLKSLENQGLRRRLTYRKGWKILIKINKEEAAMVREVFGSSVNVYRTCRQKSQRHHYFMSCEPFGLSAMEEFRNGTPVKDLKQKYARYKSRGLYQGNMY